jgi:hypothetical protein
MHNTNQDNMEEPRDCFPHMAKSIERDLLGPMPAREFLSAYFPLRSVSPEVPSAFKEGMFREVVKTLNRKGKRERHVQTLRRSLSLFLVARS